MMTEQSIEQIGGPDDAAFAEAVAAHLTKVQQERGRPLTEAEAVVFRVILRQLCQMLAQDKVDRFKAAMRAYEPWTRVAGPS